MGASGQFVCPTIEDARYANLTHQYQDDVQCDKYYACTNGVAEEKLCDDGLVFDPLRRSEHKYDFFEHGNRDMCHMILSCVDGQANYFACPGDLVFDARRGVCVWPEDSDRTNCVRHGEVKTLDDGFTCPSEKHYYADGTEEPHPLYPHPTKCQRFYICMNGIYPREQMCPADLAFDHVAKVCIDAELIGCQLEESTSSESVETSFEEN